MEGEKDTQTQNNNLNRLKEKQQELPLVEPLIESLNIIQQLTLL